MGDIIVGTSSWADPGFVKEWYPRGLAAGERLAWYAQRFRAVELNSSFYGVPDRGTVARWAEQTPAGFRFDVKLHRLVSRHAAPLDSIPKDLRHLAQTNERGRVELTEELEQALLGRLLEELGPLGGAGKLGAFLLQLSPAFAPGRHSLEELDGVIERLAPWPVAVELRHRGWVSPKRVDGTLGYLSEHGAAFVAVDAPRGESITIMPPLDAVTRDDLAYLRLHGRDRDAYVRGRTVAERFAYRYSDGELGEVRDRAERLAEEAEDVHVMFNNNRGDDAPVAAQRLRELLGQLAEQASAPAAPGEAAGAQQSLLDGEA